MKKIEQRKRGLANKKRKSFIVIGCEGKNKTETIYLKNFVSRNCIIKFSTGNHTDPVGMANDLIEFCNNIKLSKQDGDIAYLLLDTDVNANKDEQIRKAKVICKKHNIKLITSTPTFEIWYILHYGYTTSVYSSSKAVKKELKAKLKDYNENMDIFPIIKAKLNSALINAQKLENYQSKFYDDFNNEKCNPYTGVYKLVDELIKRNNK